MRTTDFVHMRNFFRVILLIITLSLTFAGTFVCADTTPQLKITQVPVFGQWYSYIYGTVTGVPPSDYWVATLLYVPGLGWYSKPYANDYPPRSRITSIDTNGSWVTGMQTGGIDPLGTIVVAYLIPKTSYPACYPFTSGAQCVPASLEAVAVASDRALTNGQRNINWSGQQWYVKTSQGSTVSGRVGPGNNYFSDSTTNVWVDTIGKLHLKIAYANSIWSCCEIASATRLGYGTYKFYVDSRLDNLDKNATLGLFTWSDLAPVVGNREIDLEFTTWGDSILPNNAQYVIQPYGATGNMLRYYMTSAAPSMHTIIWEPTRVGFTSTEGSGMPINSWIPTPSTGVPASADERVHLNLWLNTNANGNITGPSNGQPVEVVISKFEFTPWQDPTRPTVGINGRGASDNLIAVASDKYTFKLWGTVVSKDTIGLMLNDGSRSLLKVLDPGHTFSVGDTLSVEGSLSPSTPKLLDTSTGRMTLIK